MILSESGFKSTNIRKINSRAAMASRCGPTLATFTGKGISNKNYCTSTYGNYKNTQGVWMGEKFFSTSKYFRQKILQLELINAFNWLLLQAQRLFFWKVETCGNSEVRIATSIRIWIHCHVHLQNVFACSDMIFFGSFTWTLINEVTMISNCHVVWIHYGDDCKEIIISI